MLTYSCFSRLYTTGIGKQVKSPPRWFLTPSKELETDQMSRISFREKKKKQSRSLI